MNILVNKEIIPRNTFSVDIEDRGYQFGDGIYEMAKVFDGIIFEWEAHVDRLYRSASELRIQMEISKVELTALVYELIQSENLENGYIYLQVTRGIAPRNHQFPENPSPLLIAYPKEMESRKALDKKGIKVITTEDIRWLRVDIKSLNLLGNVLAKQKAVEAGAAEAVFIRNGNVTECSSSNIFGIKGNTCYTHPANHLILNGITRQVVLRLLDKVSLVLDDTPFTKEELYKMDEVFITNTGQEVCPVIEVDEFQIGNGNCGFYTSKLQDEFQTLIKGLIPSK